MSRLLSDFLDAEFKEESLLSGRYDLEISSPGLDRPLSTRTHFKDAIFERIKLRLKAPHESGAKTIIGVLCEVLDEGVKVKPDSSKDDETFSILFRDITDAHIIFDFSKLDKHKKNAAREKKFPRKEMGDKP